MIVVDTNVVAYFIIPGAHTQAAQKLRGRDSNWWAPALLRHEWLNVITMEVSKGRFERDAAAKLYRRGLSMVQIDESEPDPIRIVNLHASSGCSSYDCQFVALAQELRVQLVTLDGAVIKAFPSDVESLEEAAK